MKARLFAAALLVAIPFDAQPATRDGCLSYLPKDREGYWHYRYRNGKKCWYQARSGPVMKPPPIPYIPSPTYQTITVEIVKWEDYNSIDAWLDWQEITRSIVK